MNLSTCLKKMELVGVFVIRQNNCLHCGSCYENCRVKAIERM